MKSTKVIIVAGGKGERLRPLTNNMAKPMVRVVGKPILEHLVLLFREQGFEEFIFALAYLPQSVKSYFKDGSKWGVSIEYTIEKEPLGNAGALTLSKNKVSDTFIVTSGDVLRKIKIDPLLKKHRDSKAVVSLVLYKNFKENPTSMVIFAANNQVTKFVERPSGEEVKGKFVWSNASFYILEPRVFDFINEREFSGFGYDVFPRLLSAGEKILAIPQDHYLIDVGTKEKLEQVENDLRSRKVSF